MLDVERRKNLSYTRDDSDNDDDDDLTRNQKTKVATSICIGPTCFDLCDDVLLFSLFRNAQVFRDTGYRYGKPEQVQIKVLVSLSSHPPKTATETTSSSSFVVSFGFYKRFAFSYACVGGV